LTVLCCGNPKLSNDNDKSDVQSIYIYKLFATFKNSVPVFTEREKVEKADTETRFRLWVCDDGILI
jgi:hypothetical protein